MNTVFILMAQYNGLAVIPVATVCRDYFPHLTPEVFIRKVSCGEIRLPLMRMDKSQKTAKGVHLNDLAKYLDDRRKAATEEAQKMVA